ncbi:MAG: hypothetical protein MO853_06670 [Candidatus Protistobacter heckmanni]|nr:hypothetical protein [Candidatus Protistobacter heckmanni]
MRTIQAMMLGDLSALYSKFRVRASGSPARWCLKMTPDQTQIAQFIRGLQIDGGRFVQAVRIDFQHVEIASSLSAEERRLMALAEARSQ